MKLTPLEEMQEDMRRKGGKAFNLQLLALGGFDVPKTFDIEEIGNLDEEHLYVVRSSSADEDNHLKTAAGKFNTKKGVKHKDLRAAIDEVRGEYSQGSVVIQTDLTSQMRFSGVGYSNLDGASFVAMGGNNAVHSIVEGGKAETEITFGRKDFHFEGNSIEVIDRENIHASLLQVENYFGTPMDSEFVSLESGKITFLQARPLPNPTLSALREHERRRLDSTMRKVQNLGLKDIVLGVGNYREILGNKDATHLSTSTFNYIFSGDGERVLGAVQLGRNELGYDLGTEIFPWVTMVGGKVYYNFAGDALQFRPRGITKEALVRVINEDYLPKVMKSPDLLNYPELRLYAQFPSQAVALGLEAKPFADLANNNRRAIASLQTPDRPPIRKVAPSYTSLEECLADIHTTSDEIRQGSAREYVKAARLAFFALEDVRTSLEIMQAEKDGRFDLIANMYGQDSPESLRDSIVYDESIGSFDVPHTEDFRYLGSFELSQPRGFPPTRHFKQGREIPEASLAELVKTTRNVLGHREKVKFDLFRGFDYLRQLYEQAGRLSGFNGDIYNLELSELSLLSATPALAFYRSELRKKTLASDVFPDPIFFRDLDSGLVHKYESRPRILFGALPSEGAQFHIGTTGYLVDAVDQTVDVPTEAKAVFVPDNIRPGSHLFTILSDHGLPVIGLPNGDVDTYRGQKVFVSPQGNYVDIIRT